LSCRRYESIMFLFHEHHCTPSCLEAPLCAT
jgi:hypothetical protein